MLNTWVKTNNCEEATPENCTDWKIRTTSEKADNDADWKDMITVKCTRM